MGKTFAEIIDCLLDGDKVRRQEWENDGTYLFIQDEKLMIFKPDDKRLHPLIVSTGDLLGLDWIVIDDPSPVKLVRAASSIQ